MVVGRRPTIDHRFSNIREARPSGGLGVYEQDVLAAESGKRDRGACSTQRRDTRFQRHAVTIAADDL